MKYLTYLLLLMTCSFARAEWEKTVNVGEQTSTYYHDKSTIKATGGIIKMLTMIDFSEAKNLKSGAIYESVKKLDGYDCKYETMAQISATYFSGPMSNGNIVFAYIVKNSELEWEPISSSPIGEKYWKIACGKN